jgi:hypothetical protein
MLRRILSALRSVLGFTFWLADEAVRGFLVAAKLLPPFPLAEPDAADLAEIASAKAAAERLADETTVKRWAEARLWGRHYPIPDRAIAQWLRGLTIDDAGLIAQADGFGMLRAHLSGAALFPGLPPVGSFESTVSRRIRNKPQPVHVPRAEVMPSPGARDAKDPFEVISAMERAS